MGPVAMSNRDLRRETTMTTATMTTVTRPTEDALIGIDRALSLFERELEKAPSPTTDLLSHLRAAQAWLMTIQGEIQADDVANDR
jgi:hypothetical protein